MQEMQMRGTRAVQMRHFLHRRAHILLRRMRVITTPAASSSLRAFAPFFASSSASAFTSSAAFARAAVLSTVAFLHSRALPQRRRLQ